MKRRHVLILNFFVLCIILFAGAAYPAASLQINAEVRPQKALIGLPVEYRITVAGGDVSAVQVVLPEAKEIFAAKQKRSAKKEDDAGDTDDAAAKVPVCIIQTAKKETVSDGGIAKLVVRLEIIYYRTGTHSLPEIGIFDAQKNKLSYTVPAITIDAVNTKGDNPDIEPPLDLSGNYWRLVWLVLALVVLGAAGFFGYRFLKKYIMKVHIKRMTPPLDIFKNEMQQLKEKQLIQNGHIEQFVFGMSLSFRKLLSQLFHFDAAEMTPDEIMSAMKKCVAPVIYEKYQQELSSILSLWELAKFAEFAPSEEIMWKNVLATEAFAARLAAEAEYVRT